MNEGTVSDLAGKTTIVVGASRGLGRGIATAFAGAGAPVVAVATAGRRRYQTRLAVARSAGQPDIHPGAATLRDCAASQVLPVQSDRGPTEAVSLTPAGLGPSTGMTGPCVKVA
jgi:NAD(P)-dependent dehydrogenase (short-subunit alcohol dehydrogenase family)